MKDKTKMKPKYPFKPHETTKTQFYCSISEPPVPVKLVIDTSKRKPLTGPEPDRSWAHLNRVSYIIYIFVFNFLDFFLCLIFLIYFCVLCNESQYVDVLSDENYYLVLLNDDDLDPCHDFWTYDDVLVLFWH